MLVFLPFLPLFRFLNILSCIVNLSLYEVNKIEQFILTFCTCKSYQILLMPGFCQRPTIPEIPPTVLMTLYPFSVNIFAANVLPPRCAINQYHFSFRKRNIACLYFFQRQIYRHRNVTFRKFFARSNVNDDSSIVKSLTQDVPNIYIMKSHRSASFLLTNRICGACGFVSVIAFC